MVADDGVSVREYTTEVKLLSIKLMLLNVPQVLLQSAIRMLHTEMCVTFVWHFGAEVLRE